MVGCGEKEVAQAAQHNGHYTTHSLHNLLIRQHYTHPTQPPDQTTECLQSEAPSVLVQ